MSEVKLGLGASPDPIFLFVGESEDEQGNIHPWHLYDHDAKKQIPIKDRALTGQLTGIRMSVKTFKDKDNVKLDLNIFADKPYVVRSGIETTFARGVLLALEIIDDYSVPLTLVVANGGEKVVFGRIHRQTGERVKVVWDKERKLFPLVNKIQQRLGQQVQTWAEVQATKQIERTQDEEAPRQDDGWGDSDGAPF